MAMPQPIAPPGSDSRLPLVLGVTGHRDLDKEDLEELRKRIRSIFAEIKKDFQETPLILLSALADGADRLVAEIADKEFKIPVVGVLPMARTLYEIDFNETSRREFSDWLDNRVRCWFELPLLRDASDKDVAEAGPRRDLQYGLAGEYIARHCQVLIALWDGQPGFTADVVSYVLNGYPLLPGSNRDRLAPIETALAYQVVTPRRGQTPPADKFQLRRFFRGCIDDNGVERRRQGDDALKAFWRAYAPVEKYNDADGRLSSALESERQKSRHYLLAGDKKDFGLSLWSLVERYAATDSLALYFQKRTLWSLRMMYVLTLAAVVCFEIHAHGVSKREILLLCFVGLLVMAFGVHRWTRKRDYQNRHQDYRALAEGLRVEFFWRLAGIPELNASVADQYLQEHASELDWIRNALRTWSSSWSCPAATGRLETDPGTPGQTDFVRERWLKDQTRYFRTQAKRLYRTEKRLHCMTRPAFAVSVLLVLFVFGSSWFEPHAAAEGQQVAEVLWHLPLVVVSLILVSTALAHDYVAKQALAEHIKTCRRMRSLFSKATRILDQCLAHPNMSDDEKASEAQKILDELVKEAVAENGAWVLLRRGRPVEVPRA